MGDASDSANKAQISVYTDSQFYRPCRYGSFQLALKRCPLSQHFMHIHGEMNTYGELNETSHKANDWMLNRVANNPDIYMRTRYSRCCCCCCCCYFFFISFNDVHYWKRHYFCYCSLCTIMSAVGTFKSKMGSCVIDFNALSFPLYCFTHPMQGETCTTVIVLQSEMRINLQVNQFINPANCDCIYSVRLVFVFGRF